MANLFNVFILIHNYELRARAVEAGHALWHFGSQLLLNDILVLLLGLHLNLILVILLLSVVTLALSSPLLLLLRLLLLLLVRSPWFHYLNYWIMYIINIEYC